ncbi:unnamed protein product [Spirodela intermedia]|uniref:Endonuclease/exonuclease/phosphatase domain-containing protein n=1 Tax=Spirodela intermedia TaxID=51605 RepID=A0ABN7E8R5_SPIIN|nr:unnamed protein product [Spirodela intermedia]
MELLVEGSQHITMTVRDLTQEFTFSVIYASHRSEEKETLWADLSPWYLAGDFNCVRNTSERQGGRIPRARNMETFNDCIFRLALIEPPTSGEAWTWSNNRGDALIYERIDRCFINSIAMSMRYQTPSYSLLDGYARPSFGMDNLRDLVANAEFLGRKHAQEYLGRHHAMSRTHHNHYASSSLFGRTCPSKLEVLIDLSDSAYPLYVYTALHYRPSTAVTSITSHNHDIIMVLIPYHQCGMHFAYQHKTDNKAHRNPLGYTTSNHYSLHNHLISTIYHPQVVRT